MPVISSFIVGLIFGIGLILSGMSNPATVLAFLDPFGNWNPSLAVVMASAVAIATVGFALARERTLSLMGEQMPRPAAQSIDGPLLIGSTLFGVGWGMVGLCPGPVILLVAIGNLKVIAFFVAMLVGMGLFEARLLEFASADHR